eukprot:5141250-Ditylum_brightwellii.AAC.1
MPPKDTKANIQDLVIDNWVSSTYESFEDELIQKHQGGIPVDGFTFPLLDTKCIIVGFQADYGNEAFQAALGIIASKIDGQPKPIKIDHLVAKETREILMNTIQPDTTNGLTQ